MLTQQVFSDTFTSYSSFHCLVNQTLCLRNTFQSLNIRVNSTYTSSIYRYDKQLSSSILKSAIVGGEIAIKTDSLISLKYTAGKRF